MNTTLAELLSALADEQLLRNLPSNPDEKIAHYGYYFSGWSPSGEIRIETEETVEVTARFDPLQEIMLGEPVVCDTAEEATNVTIKDCVPGFYYTL